MNKIMFHILCIVWMLIFIIIAWFPIFFIDKLYDKFLTGNDICKGANGRKKLNCDCSPVK